MNITIIGTGNIAQGLAASAAKAHHQVTLISRSNEKSAELAQTLSDSLNTSVASGTQVNEADLVILAVPFKAATTIAAELKLNLEQQVVLDVTNPLTEDFMGLTVGFNTSAAEHIQRQYPNALVVKGFNTVFAQVYDQGPDFGQGQQVPVFLASDYDGAKATVAKFAESLGFAAIDAGALTNARYIEPMAALNIQLGYGLGWGPLISPTWIKR